VSLALGSILLAIRGVPQPQPPTTGAVCSVPQDFDMPAVWITPKDARALIGDPSAVFVDCRSRSDYQSGHIASALSVPSDLETIPEPVLRMLAAARVIVAYCDAHSGCESSHRLAARLGELGYGDVRILKDGMPGWLQHGFPAESGACTVCGEAAL
jgi:rhodanese-related sulfurtransferase